MRHQHYNHLEDFIMLHHPSIFSDASVERYIQRNLYSYMVMFAKCPRDKTLCEELRRIIIEKGRAINQWDVRTRVMYLSVSFAPFLFRYAYKIYKFFRQFVGKVIGR